MDRRSSKKNILNFTAVILVIAMIICAFAAFGPSERREPDRPKNEDLKPLAMQTVTGNVSSDGLNPSDIPAGDSSQQSGDSGGQKTEIDTDDPNQQPKDPGQDVPADPGNSDPTPSDGGDTGGNDPGTGEGGGSGDSGGEDPGGSTEDGLVTDLVSRTILFSELDEDVLHFYAYYSDPSVSSNIRVSYRHESDQGNGEVLTGSGHNYETSLRLGRNYISVSYTDKDGVRQYERFIITYAADKADENNPTMGQNPPDISTNLDGWTGYIENDRFTFQVTATKHNGDPIYANHIIVRLNSEIITNPTGSRVFEYMLYFKQPNEGNVRSYRVSVLAWDDEGNSRYKEYQVEYYHKDDGFSIGSVTVVLDATTVGMGIFETPVSVELLKGENAAKSLIKALDIYGYSYVYGGSVDLGFYLRGLERASSFPRNVMIPADLLAAIERDGIDMWLDAHSRDSLSEYDYTRGSGWMYAVNGYYPGKGMSEYYLSDGDTLTIRFTLAYGKDVGGAGSSNNTGGRYSSYCGMWINGGFTAISHHFAEIERVEPSCTEEGRVVSECSVCGEQMTETIPKTEHQWTEVSRIEASCTEEGSVVSECSVCGEQMTETIPKTEHQWTEVSRIEASCTEDGSAVYVCSVCGGEKTEVIPALGHDYEETSRVEPTEEEDGYIEYTCSRCGHSYTEPLPHTDMAEPDKRKRWFEWAD